MVHMLNKIRCQTLVQQRSVLIILRQTYSTSTQTIDDNEGIGFGFTSQDLANAKPYTEIPGPKVCPIVGNLFSFKPFGDLEPFDRVPCCTKLDERYGPLVRLSFPLLPFMENTVEVMDPEDIEIVYRNQGKYPSRAAEPALVNYRKARDLGLGLFVANGEEWWKYRHPLNPGMMKVKAANPYLPIQGIIGNELVSHLKLKLNANGNNRHPMIMEGMFRWALESVSAIVFDRHLGCMDENLEHDSWQQEFISSIHAAFQEMVSINLNPKYRFYEAIGYKNKKLVNFYKSMDFIHETSLRLVNESKEEWAGIPEKELRKKFLPQLLNIESLSMDDKISVIFDMLLAAVDTTTYTTLINLFHLAKHPEVQENLFSEINQHVGDDETPLNDSILSKLHYLKACIKESHRMQPIIPANARELLYDIVIKGYRIPKGTMVLLEHEYVSKNAKFIKDPEIFNPDRWMRSKLKEGEKAHPFLVLPFGFGPRSCIGKRFAEQEIYIALIKLVKSFRFEYDGDKLPLTIIGLDKLPMKLDFVIHER